MTADPNTALEHAIRLAQEGNLVEAERCLRDLVLRVPGLARAHNALGVIHLQQEKYPEAEAALLRAAQLAPEDARPHLNLGKLYAVLKRTPDAERHLREAVRIDPGIPGGFFNLGVILQGENRSDEALAAFRQAIAADPRDAEAYHRLAWMQMLKYRFTEAEAGYRAAIGLRPGFDAATVDLALVLLETGRWKDAQATSLALARTDPRNLTAWSNAVMAMQYDPDATDQQLLERAQDAGRTLQATAAQIPRWEPPPGSRGDGGPSIGIVSGDLHHHPVGLLLWPLLRELKRSGVRLTLYSNGAVEDNVSRELQRLGQWAAVADHTDKQLCARIRRDAPDILIDLAGHSGSNRLGVFAARAAPAQVSWLGYFATTGTPNMDCVLMDPWHAPAGCESQFTERILRMPHTRFCFEPLSGAPTIAPRPPSAARGHITFGSFNNICKINDKVIAAWSRILAGVPRSRLVLKWRTLADAAFRETLASRLERAGIARERLELRPPSSHVAVLAEYNDIDIALDTFPFSGGQTSFDATWMGVPVVTLAGKRPAGRQTLCILGNLGQQDLAAHGEDEFVGRAIALADDPARLADYRDSARERMRASALMRPAEFAQDFLAAVRSAAGG